MAQDCCAVVEEKVRAGDRKVVLAGNPNVGKSAVFHALTGVYVEVSNYPGTTVDISSGRMGSNVIFDTPGVYGVSAFNDEERVAREVILAADVVVNVADAAHLDRDLFLTVQLIDMGFPVVVALNMMDEAKANGLAIDIGKLSEQLGVEVVPCVAVKHEGMDQLKAALDRARPGRPTESVARQLPALESPADAVMLLEDDEETCRKYGVTPAGKREEIYRVRRERADEIVNRAVSETNSGATFATRLSRFSLHPVGGLILLLAFLAFMYQAMGVWLAQDLVGITEGVWFGEIITPWIVNTASQYVSPEGFIGQLIIGEFGLLTMTLSYLFGLLLPLVVGFYLVLAFMEDSGYLPRVAVLVDRLMMKVGLNGRAIIPTILGFGCVTMATMTTRLMGTKRERTIATFLLSLAIPCSAQIAVIATMLAPLGLGYTLLFIGFLVLIYGVTGAVMNKVLPGQSSDLLIDLPPLRLPRLGNVLQKTYLKSKMFLFEAGPIFAIGSVIVAALNAWGVLDRLQAAFAPITESWLGLPRETANAFIMGFVRRDFGAAGLYDLTLTPHETMVALMTITLFVPCIASIMIILKERGKREGWVIWIADLALAVFLGGVVHRLLFWS
ncbi:MAG TPA: ferrous iron transport protein B [Symbiobacteriaceae bacterium]|nr:ferrous iron transport protein B [Symbiobacteriaceae bacterium]